MGVFDVSSRAESIARNVSEQNVINHSTDDDLHNLELEITKSDDIVVSGGGGGGGGQVTVAQQIEKLNEIGNVATDGVQLGQFLRYDGSVWTAADLTSSDIPDNNNNNGENTGLGLTAVELARKIIEGAQLWWDGVTTGAIKWLKDLSQSIRNVIDNMIEWYSDLSNNLTTFLAGAGTAIKNALGSAYTNLVNWYNDVNSKLTRFLLDPVEFIGLVVQDIAVKITNLLKDDRGVVGALFEGLFLDEFDSDGVRNPVPNNTQNNIFLGLGKGLNTIGTLFSDTVNSAVGIATTLINSIFSAGTIIKTKILETLGAGLQIAIDFFSDLSDNVQDGIKLIGEFFKNSTNVSQTIIDTVFGIGKTAAEWLLDQLQNSDPITTITEAGTNAYNYLDGLLRTGTSSLTGSLNDVYSLITGNVQSNDTNNDTGDIDMKTFDVRNVDRIFFESNDSIDTSETRPHITGFRSSNNIRSLIQYIPEGGSFQFFEGRSNILNVEKNGTGRNTYAELTVLGRITALDKINAGRDNVSSNGDIAVNSSGQVVIRSGGENVIITEPSGSSSIDLSDLMSNIVPESNNRYSLGTINKAWRRSYFQDLVVNNQVLVRGDILHRGRLGFFGRQPSSKGNVTIIPNINTVSNTAIASKLNQLILTLGTYGLL